MISKLKQLFRDVAHIANDLHSIRLLLLSGPVTTQLSQQDKDLLLAALANYRRNKPRAKKEN